MSDAYLFQFRFGIDPYLPEGVVRVFQSLSRSETPASADLADVPAPLREYLSSVEMLHGASAFTDEPWPGHPVRLVRHPASQETEYYAKSCEWEVSFAVSMHDDWYGNGGFTLFMAMVDIVGDNGVYCTECEENQRDVVTLHYKEDDDVVSVRIDAPFTIQRVPPLSNKTRAEFTPDWKPATAESFSIGTMGRFTPEMRAAAYAQVEEMYREAGWTEETEGAEGEPPSGS